MRRKVQVLIFLAVVLASSAVAALQEQGAGNASSGDSAGVFRRISSVMTEPVGLVVMGVCLIGLSFVVRRRVSGKRSRNRI